MNLQFNLAIYLAIYLAKGKIRPYYQTGHI